MRKLFKRFWDRIVPHNFWSKVFGTLTAGLITYLVISIFLFLKSYSYGNIWEQIVHALNVKLQLWIYILIQLGILSIWYLLQQKFSKLKKPIKPNQQKITKDNDIKLAGLFDAFEQVGSKVLFDSNNALYKFYGQRNWDVATESLTGIQAEANFLSSRA